jgi:hypothetical protein
MLAFKVNTSLPALRVVLALEKLRLQRGLPVRIVIDHGAYFEGARSMSLQEQCDAILHHTR